MRIDVMGCSLWLRWGHCSAGGLPLRAIRHRAGRPRRWRSV